MYVVISNPKGDESKKIPCYALTETFENVLKRYLSNICQIYTIQLKWIELEYSTLILLVFVWLLPRLHFTTFVLIPWMKSPFSGLSFKLFSYERRGREWNLHFYETLKATKHMWILILVFTDHYICFLVHKNFFDISINGSEWICFQNIWNGKLTLHMIIF